MHGRWRQYQPAIRAWIFGFESQYDNCRASLALLYHRSQGLGRDERRVAKHNQNSAAFDCFQNRPRRLQGIRSAQLFFLKDSWNRSYGLGHAVHIRSNNHGALFRTQLFYRRQQMPNQRFSRNFMQHLRAGGFHACSLPGGKDHGGNRMFRHRAKPSLQKFRKRFYIV